MSDAVIEAKFLANAEPVVGAAKSAQIRDMLWALDEIDDLSALTALCA